MFKYHAFDIKAIGYNHSHGEIQKPMQDATFSENHENIALAVISDGHGSAPYVRSDRGAEMAVKAGAEILCILFDKWYNKHPIEHDEIGSQLKKIWSDAVIEDCNNDPFTSENLVSFRQDIENCDSKITENKWKAYYTGYKKNTSVLRAYGCTLIGVIMHEKVCIGIHVGDGKCVAVYDDGSCDKPIPWDDRCVSNICTSMCDEEIRCRVHIFERMPIAVFIASDGIDDTFGDGGELYNFYRKICYNLAQKGNNYIVELEKMLPLLSEKGSKDDMSIAGIYDLEALTEAESVILDSIESENLQKELSVAKDALVNAEYRQGRYKQALDDAVISKDPLNKKKDRLLKRKDDILSFISKKSKSLSRSETDKKRIKSKKESSVEELQRELDRAHHDLDKINEELALTEHQLEEAEAAISELEENYTSTETEIENIRENIRELEIQVSSETNDDESKND